MSLVTAHALFREALSPVPQMQAKLRTMAEEKRQAEFQTLLVQDRLSDYQQTVATLLPGVLKNHSSDDSAAYPLRQLASVTAESKGILFERASGLMDQAKTVFRKKDYEKSAALFTQIIARYPDSIHAAEASFLLSESQFESKDYESAIVTIDKMVELFPDNELTGFALLRLANIFEAQDRLEDAGDIYRALIQNFKNPAIQKQASVSLKSVAL